MWRIVVAAAIGLAGRLGAQGAQGVLQLARDGVAGYVVVPPAAPGAVDAYAVSVLTNFLRLKTSAAFRVVAPEAVAPETRAIFVGLSEPACKALGAAPLEGLADQEHVWRSRGADLFLYGQGPHGNLYAVMAFLEEQLGRRWFTRREEPDCTEARELTLPAFDRRRRVSFPSRQGLWSCTEFCYQHGMNVRFSERTLELREHYGKDVFPPGVVSGGRLCGGVHSLHQYVPPTPQSHLWPQYQWLGKRDYFATHPEYFTQDAAGRRVAGRQLCFSNPGLRAEFTKNVSAHIRREGARLVVALGAEDTGGAFCECAACRKLVETYRSPGGPFYDYLLELADVLGREHPEARIKVLSYRRQQTQKPPVLPPGMSFPDNVFVVFAHVEDAIGADWGHPVNAGTCRDLQDWCKLTPQMLVWSYPVPYGKGVNLPFSNTRRLVQTLRAMAAAGVEGVYQEYATDRVHFGFGFSDLHIYLYYKLAMDVNADVPALVREFTGHQYGAAAETARAYLEELESAVATADPPVPMTPTSYDFFSYLTPERVHRWQALCETMEAAVSGDARCLDNVRRLRREVDFATLLRWSELQARFPDSYPDPRVVAGRITALGDRGAQELADLVTVAEGGGQARPLPPEFDGMAPERIRQFVPENRGQGARASIRRSVPDPEAAFGYAATVYRGYDRDLPFAFGFFQNRIGATEAPWGTAGPQRELNREDIVPGVFRAYRLGTIEVTPSCRIWLQINQGWATVADLGERLHDPANPAPQDNRWEAWVSLKFDGPAYGGAAAENSVLCDRIILVKEAVD